MATKKDKQEEPSAISQVPPTPDESRVTTSSKGPRPRVAGKLATAVYLIHRGKFSSEVPAVTRERIETDATSEDFGNVIVEEIAPAYTVEGALPKDARFGNRKVRVVHEVWDAQEAADMKRRGFEPASDADMKQWEKGADQAQSLDRLAAAERVRAHKNLRRFGRVPIAGVTDDDVEERS